MSTTIAATAHPIDARFSGVSRSPSTNTPIAIVPSGARKYPSAVSITWSLTTAHTYVDQFTVSSSDAVTTFASVARSWRSTARSRTAAGDREAAPS